MKRPKQKKFFVPPFVQIEADVLASLAIRKLSASGIRILLRFLQKRRWTASGRGKKYRIVYENSGLIFTSIEAKSDMGIATATFFDAVSRLIEVGFIDIEHIGGTFEGDCSVYSFSERWRAYGTPDFIESKRSRALPYGNDVQSNMRRQIDRLMSETNPSAKTNPE